MCFTDYEYSEVWRQTIHKARKAHRCDECADGIRPGEYYERTASLYDGSWETLRTCARCFFDRARVVARELAEGCAPWESTPPVGYLHEALREYAAQERWQRSHAGEDESRWHEPTSWGPSPITYRAEVLAWRTR